MVGAGVQASLQRPTGQRLDGDDEPRVVWRRSEQHRAGAKYTLNLNKDLRHIDDVLKRFSAPDEIERSVGERQRSALLALDELCLRRDNARAANRLGRRVSANHVRPRADERSAKAPVAAAEIKHALAFNHIGHQQLKALLKALRHRVRWNRGPNLFVPVGHLERAASQQNGWDRLHDDAEVKRQRPALDVKEVEVYEVIEVQF